MTKTTCVLEYDQIVQTLSTYTASNLGKKLVLAISPATEPRRIQALLAETDQARLLLDRGGHIPLHGLADLGETMERLIRGAVLSASELLALADLLRGCRRTRIYLQGKAALVPLLAAYAQGITPLEDLEQLIELCVDGSRVSDEASPGLKKVRTLIRALESQIESALQNTLNSWRQHIQDGYISQRNGRYVLPVKAASKNLVPGQILDASGSGATVFVEPASVRRLTDELSVLQSREEEEQYQVLAMLSGECAAHLTHLRTNVDTMASLDFILARGKYSRALNASSATSAETGKLCLKQARHPLLDPSTAVPLDLELQAPCRTLVITGPNTGGKTVVLKTVGLLAMMHQSGLHIPVAEGSSLPVYEQILADIGDGQNLEQSLSTFSAHMHNISEIIARSGPRALVLLDEIGTGTDPLEGAALAAAILEDLYNLGATTLASTHYSDIKVLAEKHPGFINGAMDFDPVTLTPRYYLLLGQGGQSNGIWIASRLGIPQRILNQARSYITEQNGQGLKLSQDYRLSCQSPASPITTKAQKVEQPLGIGDRVHIPSRELSAIVAAPTDSRGMLTVNIRGQRETIPARRVKLERRAEELYPDGESYDLDIILLSKEDRKLKKKLGKGHQPGLTRKLSDK